MLVLPQKQEVLPELVLGQNRGITLEMLGQLADVPHVLLFGGRPVIF